MFHHKKKKKKTSDGSLIWNVKNYRYSFHTNPGIRTDFSLTSHTKLQCIWCDSIKIVMLGIWCMWWNLISFGVGKIVKSNWCSVECLTMTLCQKVNHIDAERHHNQPPSHTYIHYPMASRILISVPISSLTFNRKESIALQARQRNATSITIGYFCARIILRAILIWQHPDWWCLLSKCDHTFDDFHSYIWLDSITRPKWHRKHGTIAFVNPIQVIKIVTAVNFSAIVTVCGKCCLMGSKCVHAHVRSFCCSCFNVHHCVPLFIIIIIILNRNLCIYSTGSSQNAKNGLFRQNSHTDTDVTRINVIWENIIQCLYANKKCRWDVKWWK